MRDLVLQRFDVDPLAVRLHDRVQTEDLLSFLDFQTLASL